MVQETQHTVWPSTPFPEDIKNFIARFYEIADDFSEAATHNVETLFLPNAQARLSDQTFQGFERMSPLPT